MGTSRIHMVYSREREREREALDAILMNKINKNTHNSDFVSCKQHNNL